MTRKTADNLGFALGCFLTACGGAGGGEGRQVATLIDAGAREGQAGWNALAPEPLPDAGTEGTLFHCNCAGDPNTRGFCTRDQERAHFWAENTGCSVPICTPSEATCELPIGITYRCDCPPGKDRLFCSAGYTYTGFSDARNDATLLAHAAGCDPEGCYSTGSECRP